MAKRDKSKEKSNSDDRNAEFHELKPKPLRGGGSRQSVNRKKHTSTASYESSSYYRKGCCYRCLKATLSCYNIIVLLIGLTALAIGVWMMVKDLNAREVSFLITNKYYEIGACLLIAAGAVVALLAFCGCCGTMKEDRCVLGFYASTLLLMLLFILSSCILAFVFRDHLTSKIKFRMKTMVVEEYGVNMRNTERKMMTDAWDSMQREVGCCGAFGGINTTFSWKLFSSSEWYKQSVKKKFPLVPESCCKGDNPAVCTGVTEWKGPPWRGPPVPLLEGDRPNPYLYTDGCYDKLMEHLDHHIVFVGIIAANIPVFLLIGTVIAFILCAMVRKEDVMA